jgi:hypothetical protein
MRKESKLLFHEGVAINLDDCIPLEDPKNTYKGKFRYPERQSLAGIYQLSNNHYV